MEGNEFSLIMERLGQISESIESTKDKVSTLTARVDVTNNKLENHLKWAEDVSNRRDLEINTVKENSSAIDKRVEDLEETRATIRLFKWPVLTIGTPTLRSEE